MVYGLRLGRRGSPALPMVGRRCGGTGTQASTRDSLPGHNSSFSDPRLGLCGLAGGMGNQRDLGLGQWGRERNCRELGQLEEPDKVRGVPRPRPPSAFALEHCALVMLMTVAFLQPGLWPVSRL